MVKGKKRDGFYRLVIFVGNIPLYETSFYREVIVLAHGEEPLLMLQYLTVNVSLSTPWRYVEG
jgi:hypothetical protein